MVPECLQPGPLNVLTTMEMWTPIALDHAKAADSATSRNRAGDQLWTDRIDGD
jgi:hypothetical protein